MKTALCQYDIRWEDKEASKKKILEMAQACAGMQDIDWLIFSEMTLSGFTMNAAIASLLPEDLRFFGELARKHSVNVSFGGVQEGFNKLITMDRSGKIINAYSKMHLYAFGGEDRHYSPGTRQETFEMEGLRVTPAVCFDLRFPYLFWNAAEKTDIYLVIAAWPARRAEHWTTLLRARAVENQCYCIGVNRTGAEGKVEYSGNSMIYDPLGKVALDCGTADGIFISETDVTKELVEKTRTRFPFLKERKPGAAFV
ncbi:MAG: nitrilase-related carbon-nitrogen hydrolase [bacterium]